MFKKVAIIGLFTMLVFAMVPTATMAAGWCLAKNGSTCIAWYPGSTVWELDGFGFHPGDTAFIRQISSGPLWAECDNSGGNRGQGLQLADGSDNTLQQVVLTASQVDENGRVELTTDIEPSAEFLANLNQQGICNRNHVVVDVYFQLLMLQVDGYDDNGDFRASYAVSCELPGFMNYPATYDKKTGKPEYRELTCVRAEPLAPVPFPSP